MPEAQIQPSCGCDAVAGAPLLSIAQAVELSLDQISPLRAPQPVLLADALGRHAAQVVTAPRAMPFFDNSAMDGFALRCCDLHDQQDLPVAGTVAAGTEPGMLPPGQAMRIYTGAPLPRGADAVVMVEQCTDQGDRVRIMARPTPGQNIRRQGSDQDAGQPLLTPGTRIAPRHIGLLAANGITHVPVTPRPRVAVFSTGDELYDGGTAPQRAGRIPDANRPMLLALASAAGAIVTDLGILPDDLATTTAALRELRDHYDLILTSGAVSMGGRDHVQAALRAAGGTVKGWKVAVKPGKPVLFGTLGQTALTGLPGNPFAALVGFHLFALPQIARLGGRPVPAFADAPARAGFDWIRKPGRAEVFPVRITGTAPDGQPILTRLGAGVSATLFPLAQADGLALVPPRTAQVQPGDALRWHPFDGAARHSSPAATHGARHAF